MKTAILPMPIKTVARIGTINWTLYCAVQPYMNRPQGISAYAGSRAWRRASGCMATPSAASSSAASIASFLALNNRSVDQAKKATPTKDPIPRPKKVRPTIPAEKW